MERVKTSAAWHERYNFAMATVEREIVQRPRRSSGVRPFPVSKDRYYKMGAQGWFVDKRVELIEGVINGLSPIGSRHWIAVIRLTRIFARQLSDNYTVSFQNSLDANSRSEPVPDVAIITGNEIEYLDGLPNTAKLAIEVSDLALRYDRSKIDLFARAGIREYWIVNVKADCAEDYRGPSGDRETRASREFAELSAFAKGDKISPLVAPDISIAVSDLVP